MTLNPPTDMNEAIELDWLSKWARYSPEKTAVKDGDTGRSFTYAELFRLAKKAADYLKNNHQIQAGDRVAVLSPNELEHLFLFYGLQRLGAILVPVNYRLTAKEISHIVSDSQPKVLFFHEDYREVANEMQNSFGIATELFVSSLRQDLSFSEKIKTHLEEFGGFNADFNSPVMILYTSGTTGAPKGAVLTQRGLYWNSINTSISLNLTHDEVTVTFAPFFHTGGWNVLTTPMLHRGGRIIFLKKFDAGQILDICEEEKVTLMFGVPTTMDMLAQHQKFQSSDLRSLRYVIVGGEPMPLVLIKIWDKKGIPVRQGFGLTEFGPNCFSLQEQDAIRKIGSIGFANFYVQTRIVDENDQEVGRDQVGELLLRGPMVMQGYWQNEKATADTIRNGWLHTGDLVRCDGEGYFYVVGRKKDMFISGGENVYPVEVEQVLRRLQGVREAAVIGIPDTKWGEVGKAFVVRENERITEDAILNHCRESLAKYKIPKKIVFLESLPKGDSGKILKKNLPRD